MHQETHLSGEAVWLPQIDRYPVDDISRKTNCEMHQSMKHISMKVAVGNLLPSGPGQLWHGREIRAGYARVGVDAIMPGYESLELDIAGPEEETTLGEVLGGVILWDKKHIVFPSSESSQFTTHRR
jgi:hypothetical protein